VCYAAAVGVATVCYCSVCPGGNTTCQLKPNGQCFAAVELDADEWVLSHGCLAPVDDEGGIILQVRVPVLSRRFRFDSILDTKSFFFDSMRQSDKFAACTLIFK